VIEIKFDSNNESILVDYLKQLFKDNPILLHNVVESVAGETYLKNEIQTLLSNKIQDLNFEDTIKDLIDYKLNNFDLETLIDDSINDNITQHIRRDNVPDLISECVNNKIEDRYSDIDHAIDNKLNSFITEKIKEHAFRSKEALNTNVNLSISIIQNSKELETVLSLLEVFANNGSIAITKT
jgi:hypothetical protein